MTAVNAGRLVVMRSRAEGRASRIYAGSDPLPPVNPLVPFALIPVLIGVDTVRSFCAQHAYGLYGHGPKVEYLERGILWLFAGAVVELRESTYAGWWFSMVIEDWQPAVETQDSR